MLKLEEVAAQLGISYNSVRGLIEKGELAAVRSGTRTIRIEQSEVDRFKREHGIQQAS